MLVTKKRRDEMEPETRVHPLNENAVRLTKSLSSIVGLKGLGVHHVEVEPGRVSTEFHFHHSEEECIYMLSGTLQLQLGEELHTISAGDFVGHSARSEPHVMTNVSGEPATYLLFGQRLDKDIVDYPNIGKRLVIDGETELLEDLPSAQATSLHVGRDLGGRDGDL